MIRYIINGLFLVVFLTLSLPVQLVLWIIGFFKPSIKDQVSLKLVTWAFWVIGHIAGAKVTVIGEENVPTDQPVLYISNHRSYYDIILTYSRVKRLTGYIAKAKMAYIPSFATWMRYLHCVFLNRNDVRKGLQSIKDAIALIERGVSIYVCPEGTRNKTDAPLLPFHSGTFKIAERSGCTIIPITVNNTDALYEQHIPFIRPGHVIIEYGAPIETKDMTREEKKGLCNQVRDIILETYLRNQALV